jgi:curved DNA-binding protein CbpA
LGVGKTTLPGEIKKASRTLAHKYHPDKTKGDKATEEIMIATPALFSFDSLGHRDRLRLLMLL